jgi:hypothetical protein
MEHNTSPKVTYTKYVPDSIVNSVIEKYIERAEMGENKYGVTMDRTDLSLIDYIEHAIQEHMDAVIYLTKAKKLLEEKNL